MPDDVSSAPDNPETSPREPLHEVPGSTGTEQQEAGRLAWRYLQAYSGSLPMPESVKRRIADTFTPAPLSLVDDPVAASAAKVRTAGSYQRTAATEWRIRMYSAKRDRAALVVLVTSLAIATIVATSFGYERVGISCVGASLALMSAHMAFQSGREGFRTSLVRNDVDDLAASLPAMVLRGHHRVHEAEQALVQRASNTGSSLMVLDLWTQPRGDVDSSQYKDLQRAIDAYSQKCPGKLQMSVSATASDWPQQRELLLRRSSANRRFFLQNPLQCDAILADDEVILSFPQGNIGRSFALRFKSAATVDELWRVFDNQVGNRTRVPHVPIDNEFDAQAIDELFQSHHRFLRPSTAAADQPLQDI